MIFGLFSILFSGVVFGALYYMAVVQLGQFKESDMSFARDYFQAVQENAAAFFLSLSAISGVSGLICWFQYNDLLWLLGSSLLFLVMVVHMLYLTPLEKKIIGALESAKADASSAKTWSSTFFSTWIKAWIVWHWVRVALAGSAFIVYIYTGLD